MRIVATLDFLPDESILFLLFLIIQIHSTPISEVTLKKTILIIFIILMLILIKILLLIAMRLIIMILVTMIFCQITLLILLIFL